MIILSHVWKIFVYLKSPFDCKIDLALWICFFFEKYLCTSNRLSIANLTAQGSAQRLRTRALHKAFEQGLNKEWKSLCEQGRPCAHKVCQALCKPSKIALCGALVQNLCAEPSAIASAVVTQIDFKFPTGRRFDVHKHFWDVVKKKGHIPEGDLTYTNIFQM